jgi:hypothetical protein
VTTSVYGGACTGEGGWEGGGGGELGNPMAICDSCQFTPRAFALGPDHPALPSTLGSCGFPLGKQPPEPHTQPGLSPSAPDHPEADQYDWWLSEFSHENNHCPQRGRAKPFLPGCLPILVFSTQGVAQWPHQSLIGASVGGVEQLMTVADEHLGNPPRASQSSRAPHFREVGGWEPKIAHCAPLISTFCFCARGRPRAL